jgi:trehalose synthase
VSTPAAKALEWVPVAPVSLERFRQVLDDGEYEALMALAARARGLLEGRVVWCVNSTARGGGVAEMLRSLLAFTRGAGVDTRWIVERGNTQFFAVTKRLHNRLHNAVGDGGPLRAAEREVYEATCLAAATELVELVDPHDVVLLHDPQTAGMAPHVRAAGIDALVWRSHVGVDQPTDLAREAWDFLRPYVAAAAATVFSREQFVWEGLGERPVVIIPPSIDVFSAKNQPLRPEAVDAILRVAGVLHGGAGAHEDATFVREDGTPGRVDRHATLHADEPIDPSDRLVVQVSRWDRLKDPVGVLVGFAAHVGARGDARLLLVGPASERVADDPEGLEVLQEVIAAREALPAATRRRTHLVSLPMEDVEENAAMVNALQSRADVVVQKSLAEGFGLTAAEAMWKGRPVVASRVGGLQDQVVHESTGLLVEPTDLDEFGRAVVRLIDDRDLAVRLGTAAQQRVREQFIAPRHLGQWVELIARLGS